MHVSRLPLKKRQGAFFEGGSSSLPFKRKQGGGEGEGEEVVGKLFYAESSSFLLLAFLLA